MTVSGRAQRLLLRGEVDGGERWYLLRSGVNRLGRSASNQIVLAVPGVSKRHAAVIVESHEVRLQDLASKNGSFVNGRRAVDAKLRPGDEVRLGPVSFVLESAPRRRSELAIELRRSALPIADGETTTASGGAANGTWRDALAFPDGYLPAASPPMLELYRVMAAVARSELPVLIAGETGAGKEAIARTLHRSSHRAAKPFVAINCAAIPDELLEAELFGIVAGAATGVAARIGVLRAAGGGSVLLDEIGDMPPALQSKLLRALEEEEVRPVGAAHPVAIDVRVIAATHASTAEGPAGGLRRDLYYRVAGCVLRVPPLRERVEDLPDLIEHFLERAARRAGRGIRGLTAGALHALCERPWPGNVRELEHEIRRLVYLAAESEVLTERTVAAAGAAGRSAPPPARGGGLPEPVGSDLDLASLEQRAVAEALRRSGGNRSRAAQLLGISRFALRRRLERHGLAGGGAAG